MKESVIQSKIIEKLSSYGWEVIKNIQTNQNGHPDLSCYRSKITVFVEVKIPGGKLSPLQSYRITKLRAQGFEVIIASSENDVAHLCQKHC